MDSPPVLKIWHRAPTKLQRVRSFVENYSLKPKLLQCHPADERTDTDRDVAEILPRRKNILEQYKADLHFAEALFSHLHVDKDGEGCAEEYDG